MSYEIIGSGGMLQAIIFICVGLFGISLGGIFSTLFGGTKTSSNTKSNADILAQKERDHQILMADKAADLAQKQAVIAEASSKKTMMYVGIGGVGFMMMMMMMMRK